MPPESRYFCPMRYLPITVRVRLSRRAGQHPPQGARGVYRLDLGPALWDAEVAGLLRELGLG